MWQRLCQEIKQTLVDLVEIKFSVIVCAHNPRGASINQTLDGLKRQNLPKDQWELLLVDNRSDEPLAALWDLSWHPNGRHVREDELGLTPARLRGIREVQGSLILFVDDDNILAPDYLEVALKIHNSHPSLGCFGAGIISPEFETEPEPELLPYTRSLALRNEAEPIWSNDPNRRPRPCGAGLVTRCDVALEYEKQLSARADNSTLDRKGGLLLSGGDDEFSFIACAMGYGQGVFPELTMTHIIPSERVSEDYLARLREGIAYSSVLVKQRYGIPFRHPEPEPAARNILKHLLHVRPGRLYRECRRLWELSRVPETQAKMELATRNGTRKACEKLREEVVKFK